jgi:hypothetical protein
MRLREALVVEAAVLNEAGDGFVDPVFRVLAGEQAVAALGARECPPSEEIECVGVGGGPGLSSQTG